MRSPAAARCESAMANYSEREMLQRAYLSGDRFGYAEGRVVIRTTQSREALWRGTVETAKSLECHLATSPETVAYNFGRLRALFLELALAECEASKPVRSRRKIAATGGARKRATL